MNAEQEYINKNFFQPEEPPKFVGRDYNGHSLYTGDEVYVVDGQYMKVSEVKGFYKLMAKELNAKVKVL